MKYKIVEEYAAPTYYDYETGKELYDECDATLQAYWVCSWDEDEQEIIEWIERFQTPFEAREYMEKLEKGDENE